MKVDVLFASGCPLGMATLDRGVKLVLLGYLVWKCWWIALFMPLAPRKVPAASSRAAARRSADAWQLLADQCIQDPLAAEPGAKGHEPGRAG